MAVYRWFPSWCLAALGGHSHSFYPHQLDTDRSGGVCCAHVLPGRKEQQVTLATVRYYDDQGEDITSGVLPEIYASSVIISYPLPENQNVILAYVAEFHSGFMFYASDVYDVLPVHGHYYNTFQDALRTFFIFTEHEHYFTSIHDTMCVLCRQEIH